MDVMHFLSFFYVAAQSTQNWWLSYWVENEGGLTNTTAVIGEEFDSNNDAMYYLSIYGYILIGYVVRSKWFIFFPDTYRRSKFVQITR